MIPCRLVIRIDRAPHRRIDVHVPLWLVWLALLPFAGVLAVGLALWCVGRRINPIRLSWAVLRVIGSANGTHVEIQHPDGSFLISMA
jgi:hypothetical protein